MSKIFITGDTHSTYDFKKIKDWKIRKTLSKKDVLIITGDFGFVWNDIRSKFERYWLEWMDNCVSCSICFVDGNHENFNVLEKLPRTIQYGAEVGLVGHHIFHLLRGNIYKINKKRILAIGGAHSHDRETRQWEKSMWIQEEITLDDIDKCYHNLSICHNKVDYVVSHAAPVEIAKKIIPLSLAGIWLPDHSEEYLSKLYKYDFEWKTWFCGHYHDDVVDPYGRWRCLYNEIHDITETEE